MRPILRVRADESENMKRMLAVLAALLTVLAGCRTVRQPVSVTISGQVAKPGAYTVPPGSTVQDVIEAAGSFHGTRTFYNPGHATITKPDGSKTAVKTEDWSSTVVSPGDRISIPVIWF